jgi:imidazolonepropionase-like amidohydrolase
VSARGVGGSRGVPASRRAVLGALAAAWPAWLASEAHAQPGPATQSGSKPAPAPAPPKAVALVGGAVHVGDGKVLDGATLVLEGGFVSRVGVGLAAPAGAEVIDAKGLVVTPGLVEPLGAVGTVEIELEASARELEERDGDAQRAAFRAADAFNPASTVIGVARAGGLTACVLTPAGGLVSGQSAWAELRGATADEALVERSLAMHARVSGHGPATSLLRLREALDDALAYSKNRASYERNQSRSLTGSRLDLEALARCLPGAKPQLPLVVHVDRASDVTSSLALAKSFGLELVIGGGAEAHRVRDALAKAAVPVILFPLSDGPETFSQVGARSDAAKLLRDAGVEVALSTGGAHEARKLRQAAGNAVRAGLAHAHAVAAITSAPARIFGQARRVGTLEPKRVANVAVWSGDPLELGTRLQALFVRGERQSLDNRQTALLAKYRTLPSH